MVSQSTDSKMHVYDVYMQLRKYASRSKFDVVSNKRKNEAPIGLNLTCQCEDYQVLDSQRFF